MSTQRCMVNTAKVGTGSVLYQIHFLDDVENLKQNSALIVQDLRVFTGRTMQFIAFFIVY